MQSIIEHNSCSNIDDGSLERMRDKSKFTPGQTHIHRDRMNVNVKTKSIKVSNINRKRRTKNIVNQKRTQARREI